MLIKSFLLRQWKYVLGIVMLIVGIFAAKSAGKREERLDNLNSTLKRVKEKQDVEDRVDSLSDDDVDRILRDNDWFRK